MKIGGFFDIIKRCWKDFVKYCVFKIGIVTPYMILIHCLGDLSFEKELIIIIVALICIDMVYWGTRD